MTIGWIRAQPGLGPLLTMYFLVMLAFNLYYVTFPVFAVRSLGWSIRETGVFFAVMGLLMVAVQGPFYRWVTNRVTEQWLVLTGGVVLAVGFRLFDASSLVLVYIAVVLLAVGNGVMWPSILSLLSKAAGTVYQGTVQGFAGSLGAIASVTGLLAGGMMFATLGPRIFWISAAVTLLVALIGGVSVRRQMA